jgi:hypothetical protein
MKPQFELLPPRELLIASEITQEISELEMQPVSPACTEEYRTRLVHRLCIINHNFSVKHSFTISYATDTEAAKICDTRSGESRRCSTTTVREFPRPQMYLRGPRKNLIELLCWFASPTDRDFNLQINVRNRAFSSGTPSEELEQINDEVCLVAHCEYPEEAFSL